MRTYVRLFLFFFILALSPLLRGSDSLSYGIEMKNGEYIRKSLKDKSQRDLEELFSSPLGEKIAKAYIEEAFRQPIALVRLEGFLGGIHPSNATSALYLEKALDDPHAVIRSFARRASMGFFDSFIQKKLLSIARFKKGNEKIEAFAILVSQNKTLALQLANELFHDTETPLLEKIEIHEILSASLLQTDPELKSFIAQNTLTEDSRLWLGSIQPDLIRGEEVLAALKSASFSSQLGALECIGLWKNRFDPQSEEITRILAQMLASSNSRIKAKAAWTCYCQIPELKEEALSSLKALSQTGDKEAELVSEVLCRSGIKGLELSKAFMKDPYAHPLCRMNAAVQLLRYRSQLEQTPFELLFLLKKISRPLSFDEHTPGNPILFQTLEDEEIERQVTLFRDVEVRSFLLGFLLNCSDSPKIEQEAYKVAEDLLKKKSWGPLLEGGSLLFLQVGPKSVELAKRLSMSFHEEVRIQAAGILAALGCRREALDILEMSFPSATFEGKMALLAILPNFPFDEALPFLISSMKEKSVLIRTRASGLFLLMKYRY